MLQTMRAIFEPFIFKAAHKNISHAINLFIEFVVKHIFGGDGKPITKNILRDLRAILIIFI